MDPRANLVSRDGLETKLSPLAMDVLLELARNAGQVVSTEALLSSVWGDRSASESSVYKVISELRSVFKDRASDTPIIKTVPKRGYRLTAEVTDSPFLKRVGKTGNGNAAIESALNAGREAMAALKYDLAVKHFNVALRLLEAEPISDPEIEGHCYIMIAQCLLLEQGMEAAAPYIKLAEGIAEKIQSPVLKAQCILARSGGLQPIISRFSDMKETLQTALALIPRSEKALINRMTSRIISYTRPVTEQLIARAEENVARARDLHGADGDVDVLCHAMVTLHELLMHPDYYGRRSEISDELLVVCTQSSDSDIVVSGFTRAFADAIEGGDLERALGCKREMELAKPRPLYHDDLNRLSAFLHMMQGDLEAAEEAALSINVRETGHQMVQLLQLLYIRREQNRLQELTPLIEYVAEEYPEVPAVTAQLALCYAVTGDIEAASEETRRIGDLSQIVRDLTWPSMMVALIETAAIVGDRTLADQLLAEIDPYLESHVLQSPVCYFGVGHFFSGLLHMSLERSDEARHHLELALARHEAMRCAPLVNRNRRLLAGLTA